MTVLVSDFEKQNKMAVELLKLENKIVSVIKVTRAGTTTSLIKEAIDAHKKVVIFVPTHEIGRVTINKAVTYADRKNAKILSVDANSELCSKIKLSIEKNDNLRKLKWFLLPSCSKCVVQKTLKCRLQEILSCEDWDVLVVTYSKLRVLTLGKGVTAQRLLAKIQEANVAIFDEYTDGLLRSSYSANLSSDSINTLLQMVEKENNGAEYFWDKIVDFSFAATSAANELKRGSGTKFVNPLEELDILLFKEGFQKFWNILKKLTAEGYDTDFVQEVFHLVCFKELFIQKSRDNIVTIKPIEPLSEGLSFINGFIDEFTSRGKLSVLVDSHLPDFPLQEHFRQPVEPFFWGDPNNTNSRLVYLCDSKRIGEFSMQFSKTQAYLQEAITRICEFHTKESNIDLKKILIVCQGKSMAKIVAEWKAEKLIPNVMVTWYRSSITRGVTIEEDPIVQIMIGGPYIPVAAYHHKVALETEPDKAKAWDSAFRKSNMVSEFINASSRVKDPECKRDSYVYCLGITHFEAERFLDLANGGAVKQPLVVGFTSTGVDWKDFILATRFFQQRETIDDPERDIPCLVKLCRAYIEAKAVGDKESLPVHLLFRDKVKTSQAHKVIERNSEFLRQTGVAIEKSSHGYSIRIQNYKNNV